MKPTIDKPLAAALDSLANDHRYLAAPRKDGEERKYLPCSGGCGLVDAVPLHIVSFVCTECSKADGPDDGPDRTHNPGRECRRAEENHHRMTGEPWLWP